MFICGICKKESQHREKPTRLVLERRDKTYPFRKEANLVWLQSEQKWELQDDPGGVGWEIVRETDACNRCTKH